MQSRIVKWGNSLGVRIPSSMAKKIGFVEGTPVDFQVKEGTLIIRRKYYSLEEFISRITPDNIHSEIDTGSPVGREVW
ncbi:MAG: AbrB/MazE/SpoVT family DNA-binding domain-containing protein [Thermoanaerobacteraceae bacterium]|nr:AbrB/MazE/SpoVT family DNA-binding domain-containing protein [Thermoanaerobacteraceae bacterium]